MIRVSIENNDDQYPRLVIQENEDYLVDIGMEIEDGEIVWVNNLSPKLIESAISRVSYLR